MQLHDEHVYAAARHASDIVFADIVPSHRSQGALVRRIAEQTAAHGSKRDRKAARVHLAQLDAQ